MSIETTSERWELNESLLQSYRSIFIASQSILVAAGVMAVASIQAKWITLLISGIAIFQLILGFSVVKARGMIVDFHKFNLAKRFDKNGEILSEKECSEVLDEHTYVHESKIRKKISKTINKKLWRETRVKIDIIIPLSFLVIWICFIVYKFISV